MEPSRAKRIAETLRILRLLHHFPQKHLAAHRNPPANPILYPATRLLNFAQKYYQMSKRYSESEKRQIVSSWLSSGRRCAAYARECGISALTLKSWHLQYAQSAEPSGFISITAPEVGGNYGFRVIIGAAVLEFDRLPPVDYVRELLQMRSR